ncbi:chromosome transmission fidelity protein 18 homolog isoform X2 [Nematostella vectensis]|uniref:chromosome transmission fidelity protein 18 homolog isoform X2 n=1 Tax=Nematostella vectensis TaxID=45351 RepID=UPI00207747FF|nr:chromosome transmission fidelity protein 18 homolog isoform X2 [Nematostella vectensis]
MVRGCIFVLTQMTTVNHSCQKKNTKLHEMRRKFSQNLLQVPFHVLQQQVNEQRRSKARAESDRVMAAVRRAVEGTPETQPTGGAGEEEKQDEEESTPLHHGLWVEKYSPRHFTELLSDDAINRTLLQWLKLWDKVVFRRERKPVKHQPKEQKSNMDKKHNKDFRKFGKGGLDSDAWTEVDDNGYPVHKVALLCGPPGLGKTTLAHVIAQHAGYNVVEMNASDDRAVEVFRQKIEVATQMKSVLGANERPNCLVIDEIDGAPTPAINVLLSVLKQKQSDGGEVKKGKKKKKILQLLRPVICICNDQFVPSLRQLRQQALVAVFPQTIPGRLSSRLLEIARREGVSTDMTTLLALCDKAENDIRSCLNTLQFVHRRHGKLALEHVQSTTVGQKDLHKNLFTIWHEIFQLPKPKRKRFGLSNTVGGTQRRAEDIGFFTSDENLGVDPTQNVSSLTTRFHNILRLASSSGQYEKLMQGLFENYLNIKFKDTGLSAVVSGTEWLEFSDVVERKILQSQSFMLRGYSSFLSVAFHLLYATPTSSKLSYPSSQYECHLREVKTMNLLESLKSEACPRIRQVLNQRIALLDLFPLLLEIITPTLRPVNMQLFSAREKKQVTDLIDTMIAYNLTYHQERNSDGQYNYTLDPNIEEAVKFPGLAQHKQLTYATKQLVAREIDLEKMRRAESVMYAHAQDTPSKLSSESKAVKKEKPNVVTKLDTTKVMVKEEKVALDFFGRPIKRKEPKNAGKGSDGKKEESKCAAQEIWFRFNEGYSNAVRKNIKIQELL